MAPNVGAGDRTIRAMIAVASLFTIMEFAIVTEGALRGGIVAALAAIALLMAGTAMTAWCPLYQAFRVDTREPPARTGL